MRVCVWVCGCILGGVKVLASCVLSVCVCFCYSEIVHVHVC